MTRRNNGGKFKKEIEKIREQMISSGMSKGLDHPDTIKLSQELDELINKAMLGGK